MKKYFTIVLFLFFTAAAVFSHAMFLELVEPGLFQVEYDGGGFSPGTKIILYSDGGFTQIEEGVVDDKGFYKFDPSLEVMSAEASDGAGHIAYWENTGDEETAEPKSSDSEPSQKKIGKKKRPSKIPTVLTVLNTCALIYLFFEFRTFKKKSKNK